MSKKSRRNGLFQDEGKFDTHEDIEIKIEKIDTSPQVSQHEKLKEKIVIKERSDLTSKQLELLNIIQDKNSKIVFIRGPSGSTKSFCGILSGLRLLNLKKISEIIYIRSAVESADHKLGYLPGDIDVKFNPYLMPLYDKLNELLSKNDIQKLEKEERINAIPISFLRGRQFNCCLMILEEAQNMSFKEILTAITRIGPFTKAIVIADPDQSDINGKSGFSKFFDLFNDEESKKEGIFCFEFNKNDILRSDIVRFIIEKVESLSISTTKEKELGNKKTQKLRNPVIDSTKADISLVVNSKAARVEPMFES